MNSNDIFSVIQQTSLPIVPVLSQLQTALVERNTVLLQAEPGAGKTTLVPLCLLPEVGGKIIMLEPRRLAAKTAAIRIAELLQEPVGQTVGYRVRNESKVSANTRIEVVTEGILTRMMQSDPELTGVSVIIFDEFHERSLHADLGLALAHDVQDALRDDLKLVIMSATLNLESLGKQLENCECIYSEGRCHPVSVDYLAPPKQGEWRDVLLSAIGKGMTETSGDVLVFLPGVGEIRWAEQQLQSFSDVLIVPLYGDLELSRQKQAMFAVSGQRRIVLSTNIAETSVTIEGVTSVIDSGLCRQTEFEPGSGLNRLVTRRISRASAEQRAGRAGRLSAGVCYRLWSESESLAKETTPEILRTDLSPLVLELAQWGVHSADALHFPDVPPSAPFAQAQNLLQQLDALDGRRGITALGKNMLALGCHPRLAHMILRAVDWEQAAEACLLAAMLEERDFIRDERRFDPDIGFRFQMLCDAAKKGRSDGAIGRILSQAEHLARKLSGILGLSLPLNRVNCDCETGPLLALAYPDRVAQKRGQGYRLRNGRGAVMPDHYPWSAAFVVVAQLSMQERNARIYWASPLDESRIREIFADQIEEIEAAEWDKARQKTLFFRKEELGSITLSQTALIRPDPRLVMEGLLAGIRAEGLLVLPWSDSLRQWLARVRRMNKLQGKDCEFPDFSENGLLENLEIWLQPFLAAKDSLKNISVSDLTQALQSQLSWEQQRKLNDMLPETIEVPSGSRIKIDYLVEGKPVLAVKLQEMFGLQESPQLAQGRLGLSIHLLSPAGRPLQITEDLASFWSNAYVDVRKEMKGRYPKHPWPENPMEAVATRHTKKHMQRGNYE